jgi:predicted Zn-dependent protease with MMP-like domain
VSEDWQELLGIAEEEVNRILRTLPDELKEQAAEATVVYERNRDVTEEEPDPDLLGLFVGGSVLEFDDGMGHLPPQIILFLDNLWEFSDADETIYRREVRTTFLHELGHYLGLEELDLDERGL